MDSITWIFVKNINIPILLWKTCCFSLINLKKKSRATSSRIMITGEQAVFRSITLTGFWLAKVLGGMSTDEIQSLYGELANLVTDGTLHVNIEATYGLADIKQALAHAMREGRDGKILVTPNS